MRKFRLSGLLFIVAVGACASTNPLLSLGPRPPEIAGTWIDVAHSSATDVALVLSPDGSSRTMRVVVRDSSGKRVVVHESWNGWWYLSGNLSDSTHRAICYKRRPRDGATCLRFRLDTLAAEPRLIILGYPNADWSQPRIFVRRDR